MGPAFPDRAVLALCEQFSLGLRQGGGLPVQGRPLPGRALPGQDFEGFAEYAPGMDPRHLDWQVWARTRRLYVREYADEGAGLLVLLLDASGSMAGPKFELARGLAGVLTFAALRELHQVLVGVLHAGRAVWLPPTAGLDFAPHALRFLGRFTPAGPTDLGAALGDLPLRGARGDAVIISDFLDPRGADRGLSTLSRRRFRTDLLRIAEAAEFELPPPGTPLLDAEGPGLTVAPAGNARAAAERAIEAHRGALADAARRHAALLVELDAATPLPRALDHVFRRIAAR